MFELRISEPREVSVLTRPDEYRVLKAANVRFLGAPSQPPGQLEQDVMAGNRIYLQVRWLGWERLGGGRACATGGRGSCGACWLLVGSGEACSKWFCRRCRAVCVQGGERITLPFKIQSLAPPQGYGSAASVAAVTQAPDTAGRGGKDGKKADGARLVE